MTERSEFICIRGARTHNLHSFNLDLPRDRLIVFTGPSGSGKSSLAFDTLHAEGQRRYLETLRGDARGLFQQLQRPDVDLIEGLPPTLCVSQYTTQARPRSTLATVTELADYLRLCWARLGTPYCPDCGIPVHLQSTAEIVRTTLAQEDGRKIYILSPLVQEEAGDHRAIFQQIRQSGFLRARLDGVLTEVRDTPRLDPKRPHTIELVIDRLVIRPTIESRLRESIETAVKQSDGRVIITDIDTGDWRDYAYTTRLACVRCRRLLPALEPRLFHFNAVSGACPRCTGLGLIWDLDLKLIIPDLSWTPARVLARIEEQLPEGTELACSMKKYWQTLREAFPNEHAIDLQTPLADWPEAGRQAFLMGSEITTPPILGLVPLLREVEQDDTEMRLTLAGYIQCPECLGARLRPEARAVRFAGRGLHEILALSVESAAEFFANLQIAEIDRLSADSISAILLPEITQRLRFLQQVGLGYLTLDRPAQTLSGGEAQRARLAMHLGGGLVGVCYILDEPTMGLHPRDTQRLLAALRGLQERGNTVLVVEHDEAVIRAADFLVDIGPGAGRLGGRLLANGTPAEVLAHPDSITGAYLQGNRRPAHQRASFTEPSGWLKIRGARHHNLQNVDVAIPLGRWTCLTGVSGSGKSSLARDILGYAVRRHLGLIAPSPGAHDSIEGLEKIDKIIEVDQKPLGRSSRSTPATYVGIFDEIRKVYALTKLAKIRGYKPNRFSFNVRGGRCEECQGQGNIQIALAFMPELTVACPACQGRRFNSATLEVLYRGRSIADILAMSIEEALTFFTNIPALKRGLQPLADVGLGYLPLGQRASTLSGGEAQRVKLAAELARSGTGRTLYLLDEPTTGLHLADIANLTQVLRRLVEAGNTLVVIEHQLDLIDASDWVIDLGPEGGVGGGLVLAQGPPS